MKVVSRGRIGGVNRSTDSEEKGTEERFQNSRRVNRRLARFTQMNMPEPGMDGDVNFELIARQGHAN